MYIKYRNSNTNTVGARYITKTIANSLIWGIWYDSNFKSVCMNGKELIFSTLFDVVNLYQNQAYSKQINAWKTLQTPTCSCASK